MGAWGRFHIPLLPGDTPLCMHHTHACTPTRTRMYSCNATKYVTKISYNHYDTGVTSDNLGHYCRLHFTQPHSPTIQHTIQEDNVGKPGSGYGLPQELGTGRSESPMNHNNYHIQLMQGLSGNLCWITQFKNTVTVSNNVERHGYPKSTLNYSCFTTK